MRRFIASCMVKQQMSSRHGLQPVPECLSDRILVITSFYVSVLVTHVHVRPIQCGGDRNSATRSNLSPPTGSTWRNTFQEQVIIKVHHTSCIILYRFDVAPKQMSQTSETRDDRASLPSTRADGAGKLEYHVYFQKDGKSCHVARPSFHISWV